MSNVDERTWELLMKRFDTIEEQNREQLELLGDHTEADDRVHGVVERHSAYFGLLSLGLAPLLGVLFHRVIGGK